MTVSPVNYHSWRRFWARMFDYFLIGFLFLLLSRNSIFALNNIFLYSALQLKDVLHLTVSPVNYHSWRRFWARMFDYFLIGFLFLLLSRNSIFALNNIFLYSALQLIVVISAEAFMLARTGTTAGKSFLELRVVSPSAPLDFNLAWKRTFWAYVKGLWLGIPIMMFVPAWFARQVLRDSGSTIWDQACGTHIEAEPVGRLRYILFAIVFFMLFAAIGNYEVFLQQIAQGQ